MPHDGLPVRAVSGVHAARADRRGAASARLSLLRKSLPAAAVAGATMLAFAACSGTAGGSSGTSATSTTETSAPASMEASTEASASAAASGGSAGIVTVIFQPANGSQILGGAVLTDQADGTTQVEIGIGSTGATDGMPAILEEGSCSNLISGASGSPGASGSLSSGAPASMAPASAAPSEAPSAPASAAAGGSGTPSGSGEAGSPAPSAVTGPPFQLTPLSGGASTTLIATTTSNLLSTPSAIVLNKSAKESTIVACADITNGSVRVPASAIPSGLESLMPSTGTEASPSSS